MYAHINIIHTYTFMHKYTYIHRYTLNYIRVHK